MNQLDPRVEFAAAEPIDEYIPEYLDPSEAPEFLSMETTSELLEHTMLQTLLNIMQSGARDSDRRGAARDTGELLKLIGQKHVNVIQAENVQMNQIEQRPELKKHLLASAKGLSQIANSSDSGVKTKQGGSGV